MNIYSKDIIYFPKIKLNIFEDLTLPNIMDIIISNHITPKQAAEIINIQKLAWNMDDIGCVPNFEIKAVSDVGFVFIAYDKEIPISFIYGFHQFPNIHYSHMMAVIPEYQGKNIGYQMKLYHRNEILKSPFDIDYVKWTVDPLLPNNAYLNFTKLGAYCDTYKPDYYGDPSSDGVGIYGDLPTDRLLITWPVKSNRVSNRIINDQTIQPSKEELFKNIILIKDKQELVSLLENENKLISFLFEVPSDFQNIKDNNPNKALEYRYEFREIAIEALNNNYVISDYYSYNGDLRHNYYEFTIKSEFHLD